jgi:hypothetical protein
MTMDVERHVDGNAIGGLLEEVVGRDMTDVRARCAACGTVNAIGALLVYRSGPGDVIVCPACTTIVLVVSALPDGPQLHVVAMSWVESHD